MNQFRELLEIRTSLVQGILSLLIDTQFLFEGRLGIEVEDAKG